MNCDWYEQQLKMDDVDLWPDGKASAILVEHARACPICEHLVQQETNLRRHLANLALRNQSLSPSPSVKRNLLAEFDLLYAARPRRTRVAYYALATAAILVLVAVLIHVRRSTVPQPAIANAPVEPPALTTPKKLTASNSPTVVAARPKKPVRTRPSTSTSAAHDDFYPIVMCDSVTCAGPALTVRVQLPRSPLAAQGSNTPVMADLLVGEDGIVRGVRLLQ